MMKAMLNMDKMFYEARKQHKQHESKSAAIQQALNEGKSLGEIQDLASRLQNEGKTVNDEGLGFGESISLEELEEFL